MLKAELLTIVKDWIHDLSYINMEIDVTHEMDGLMDTFRVDFMSSEFTISIRQSENGFATIFINHQFIMSIESDGTVCVEDYDVQQIKPLVTYDIRSLIQKLKYPPTEEMRSFCKGIEEWLSHLNNSTYTWYWYAATETTVGKCYKVQVGPFERLFRIEKRDGGIIMDINYIHTIKYIDGVVSVTTPSPVQPFTIEEIKSLRDTIKNSMHNTVKDIKIKRISEILKQWLSDMTMTYTVGDHEYEYLACLSSRPLYPAAHAYIGISVHEKKPCIWLYNTTNIIITFDPDNNWEPNMSTTYSNAYPFSNTNLTKLMAMCVKEFCNGIDYEFRNTIFFTVEQWLKRKSHSDSNYHNLTLTSNTIKNIRWNISEGYYNLEWIDNKWRLSSIMFHTYKRICDITPNGDIIMGACVGSEEKSLINEIREAIKPTPDSTDEDLLAAFNNEFRTITDIIENDKYGCNNKTIDDICTCNQYIQTPPVNFKPYKSLLWHRDVNEIKKDLNDAVHSIKPETFWFDSMTDVIENIKKQEEKEMPIESMTVKIVKQREGTGNITIPSIKHVLFNETKMVTTVIFADGDKVTSKCCDDNVFDPEVGFAMCIMKKMYGNRTKFQKVIEKYHIAGIHRNKKIAEKAARKEDAAEKASDEEI